mmetsp:Transcript_8711/g.30735  ORF Transcript_8711/g.30735 Transcript_8711/m.30735 type:complete len:329 (+) Transcript_8711:457-1443(+)
MNGSKASCPGSPTARTRWRSWLAPLARSPPSIKKATSATWTMRRARSPRFASLQSCPRLRPWRTSIPSACPLSTHEGTSPSRPTSCTCASARPWTPASPSSPRRKRSWTPSTSFSSFTQTTSRTLQLPPSAWPAAPTPIRSPASPPASPRCGGPCEIGDASRIPEFLAKAKDKTDPFKLMGFGHRVYRNLDPRAREMKRLALQCIATREGIDAKAQADDAYITAAVPVEQFVGEPTDARRLFRLAAELEEAALADEYFSSRKLFPNVDFYSGLALTAIGVPEALFTPLFAVGRGVGWIAQWKESLKSAPGFSGYSDWWPFWCLPHAWH